MTKSYISCMVLSALILMLGCIELPAPEIKQDVKAMNGTQIQMEFAAEQTALRDSINSGNIEEAEKHYAKLKTLYGEAKKIVGEEHLQYFVADAEFLLLERQLNSGDLSGARETVKRVAAGCGIEFCHRQVGSSMTELEVKYSALKGAINKGNLFEAKSHFPSFKQAFIDARANMTFMPYNVQKRMKYEYIDNLEASLNNNDLKGAKIAMEVISNNTCTFSGCHAIFFTNRTAWKFY